MTVVSKRQPEDLISIIESKLLLCEGIDEEKILSKLFEELQVSDIQIMPRGGKEQINKSLPLLAKRPEFRKVASMGIIRDADSDASAALQSVTSALESVGIKLQKGSAISVASQPRVTVLIVPGSDQQGSIEDILFESVRGGEAIACVEEYMACLKGQSSAYTLTPGNLAKAKVHAFLASQKDPDLRPGEAAEKGLWDFNHPAFSELRQFILQL